MSVTISIEHLQALKITFQDAIKVIDGLLQTETPPAIKKSSPKKRSPTTRTRTHSEKPKEPIGKCGYCSAKTMKKIKTRVEYEDEPTRCGKAAHHIKNGVLLCDRHRENDISKIVEIMCVKEDVVVDDIEEEVVDEGPDIDEMVVCTKPVEDLDIDEIIDRVSGIEKMLSEVEPQPCTHGPKPMLYVKYGDVRYVVSTNGVCYGKISKTDFKSIEVLIRRKGLFDITGKLSPLKKGDIPFLEKYELYYLKDYIN